MSSIGYHQKSEIENLSIFKNYEVKRKDEVYTINVFEGDELYISTNASTFDLAIEEIMEKYQDLQETDGAYLMRKQELKSLNKGPLKYEIMYQRVLECCSPIYSTAAKLTFTSNGNVVTGHINSWDSKNLEKHLYEEMYKQIIPSHELKG